MKKLHRSSKNKWIAGIAGGIGEVYEVDPLMVRLVFLFLGIATGLLPLLIPYLIAWCVLPRSPDDRASMSA